jgi:hypothetical protein
MRFIVDGLKWFKAQNTNIPRVPSVCFLVYSVVLPFSRHSLLNGAQGEGFIGNEYGLFF